MNIPRHVAYLFIVMFTFFTQTVIFNTIRSPKLSEWLAADGVASNINTDGDMGSVFTAELDEDYDRMAQKVTKKRFTRIYLPWIKYCVSRLEDNRVQSAEK